jgi:hypothetical protein
VPPRYSGGGTGATLGKLDAFRFQVTQRRRAYIRLPAVSNLDVDLSGGLDRVVEIGVREGKWRPNPGRMTVATAAPLILVSQYKTGMKIPEYTHTGKLPVLFLNQIPASTAIRTASAALDVDSFLNSSIRCICTVFSLSVSIKAICLVR